MLDTREYAEFRLQVLLTLLLMQRLAGLKRQFYEYLPISYPNCRHGKRSTLETALSNAHELAKILYHI